MGLFKKLAERAAANMPDYGAAIRACLPADEPLLAHAHGMHLALAADTNLRRQGLIGVGINALTDKAHQHKYLAGEPGSCALAIPRDMQSQITVAVTDRRVIMYSFGMMMADIPPAELVSFPRSSVQAITPGESSRYGTHTTFRFVDGSHVVFDMYTDTGTEAFRTAAAGL